MDSSDVERPAPGPHRTTIVLDGLPVETLADLPPLRNHLLLVGASPSPISVEAGHYHQDPASRTLWHRLVAADVLPAGTPVESADDALVAAGHGITDLLKRPTRTDDATDDDLRAGVGTLWQKVAVWRPAAILFVERRAAEAAAGRRLEVSSGALPGVALAARPCFLVPGPDAAPDQVDAGIVFMRNLAAALPRD